MRRGTAVRIRLEDGAEVRGRVWEDGPDEGLVWVALENGRYASLSIATGKARIVDARGVATGESGRAA